MRKHLITIFTVLSASMIYAQEGRVGINTSTPNATLDVTASPTDLTRTDGFIAPRLTGDELKAKDSNYTNDQTGAIVYATAPANPTTAKTINVTEAGYYYFDGLVWVKFPAKYVEPWNVAGTNNPATSNSQDIYQNGRIGIREKNPLSAIHILNDNISGNDDDIRVESYGINNSNFTMTPNLVMFMSRGSKQSPENLQYDDQIANITFRPRINGIWGAGSLINSVYKGNGNNNLTNIEFFVSGVRKMVIDEKGYLGINNETPTARLHVVKEAAELTPAIIEGCNEYADNAAAVTAGLPIGAFYRTGDVLKVVH